MTIGDIERHIEEAKKLGMYNPNAELVLRDINVFPVEDIGHCKVDINGEPCYSSIENSLVQYYIDISRAGF